MSEEKKGFVVKDRRMFHQETEEKQDIDEKEAEDAASSSTQEQPAQGVEEQSAASDQKDDADDADDVQFPEINFPTFVASLNASALVHLGVIEDPAAGKKAKNLPMAKQTIDILSMLESKTQGNLTKEEENMLKNVLYDLRILFVKEKS